MMPVDFKLTELNGLTRRVAFSDKPSWNSLATKIELLYGIPIENVSVSYIDADNDRVTLSSQEELDDFFVASHTDGKVIKFTVQNLSTVRLQRTLSQSSHNPSRNIFGIGTFEIEDDWQTLPIPPISELQGLFMPNSSNEGQPHAFVEILGSDTGTVENKVNADHKSVASSSMSSLDSPFVMSLDKGKQKADPDDDVSSTGSVLGEDAPPKPPVHVYDFQTPIHPDIASVSPFIPVESTPKADPQTLTATVEVTEVPKDGTSNEDDPTDPPLPTFDNQNPRVSTSFFNDLTSFLSTFSNVIAAHPELSEGIRNIVRNTSNGEYWHAHRDSMSQAAQNITRETGVAAEALRREVEEEARRRVADALGGIFRTLSETFQSGSVSEPTVSNSMADTQPTNEAESTETARLTEPEDPSSVSPGRPVPEIPPEFHSRMYRGPGSWIHRGSHISRPPPLTPTGDPYGPRHGLHLPIPRPPPIPGSWCGRAPPPPPPPPSRYPHGPPPSSSFLPHGPPPLGPHFASFRPPSPVETPQASKPTSQELRVQVDEAKARYQAEKEKYRLDREERRKEREMRTQLTSTELNKFATNSPHVRPMTPPAIAVQGRGGQPPREAVSIHRYHTHLGLGSSSSRRRHGHSREHSDLRTRAVNRIAKRLADMGFSESTHPDLPSKIKAQLPFDGVVRNDSEDDIVTTLLEDLLARSPKPPVASGSGAREIPGAWH